MSQIDVNSLLSQMRQMSTKMPTPELALSNLQPTGKSADFGALLKQSIAAVGQNQMDAGKMAAAFERGDSGADLGRTMVAVQKADLSLRAMTEVRNKLVDAYKDIMNMPV